MGLINLKWDGERRKGRIRHRARLDNIYVLFIYAVRVSMYVLHIKKVMEFLYDSFCDLYIFIDD